MTDPYEVRFTFFWYNDREIFFDTEEEIGAKMKKTADQGITHLITFSCTHFRWSYRPWWEQINECLAKIVKAAHTYGLKVIEHHSSELASYPDTPEHLERLRKYLLDHGSSLETWSGLVEYLTGPDSPALKWPQIHEKTGKPNITAYAATNRCYNNPEYIREYLEYLESIYATGVDGIMTDDVQFYCQCRCEACRYLFKEKYGHTLPSPEKWDEWFGDMRDPAFIDWLHFRFDSIQNFHNQIKTHYNRLGLQLLRPNYISLAITRDWTASSVETVPDLHWFFQECARACVLRYSWLKSLSEEKHRAMVAGQRGIPHGILFYAYDRDQLIFSWGTAMLSGGFYINTPEGGGCELDETQVRSFEKKHAGILFHIDEMPEVGFLDSRDNRFFSPGYEMSRMEFWMQSCIVHNLPCAMLNADLPESWKTCRILCLNELNVLSEKQIDDLKEYANDGGILMISGLPGNQNEKYLERSLKECETLWGFHLTASDEKSYEIFPFGKGKICLCGKFFGYPGPEEEIQAVFGKNHLDFRFGKMPFEFLKSTPFVCANTIRSEKSAVRSNIGSLYEGIRDIGKQVCALMEQLLGDGCFFHAALPELVLAAPYRSRREDSITIRLLNAGDTLTPPGNGVEISHDDPIPFPEWQGENGLITVRLPDTMKNVGHVDFLSLEKIPQPLPFERNVDKLTMHLPSGLLKDFGMIYIR
ncbi:MAG: hypothetical protein BWY31_01744 [Lentisphaerae bacterium ADurb.Bin242]|nr:MAG: hypothetical protein BWY31_01744 [Lentisphaerae bacterium ADurb.Bin242]